MNQKEEIKIAIVDDHAFVRDGIELVLSHYEYIKVIMMSANGKDLLGKLDKAIKTGNILPDMIILDIHLPDMPGYEVMDLLKEQYPGIRVLISSMIENEHSILKMLHAGAMGYLPKGNHPKEMISAIDKIMDGELYYPSYVSEEQIQRIKKGFVKVGLSEKEIQFLKYCCEDLSYKEMADRMSISERTVHHYRDNLLLKLGAKSKTGLAMYAVSAGFVSFGGIG